MMKNSTRIERLKRLIHVLKIQERADAKNKAAKLNGISAFFDMGGWFTRINSDKLKKGTCGSAACALGSAALNDWFKRRGLKMDIMIDYDHLDVSEIPHRFKVKEVNADGTVTIDRGTVRFRAFEGFEAGSVFFDIYDWEARWLFDPIRYGHNNIRPGEVIGRVQDLIAHYESGKDSRNYKKARDKETAYRNSFGDYFRPE